MATGNAMASVGLLLSCVAVSLVTSVAVHLYFHAAAKADSDPSLHSTKSSECATDDDNADVSSVSTASSIEPPPAGAQESKGEEAPSAAIEARVAKQPDASPCPVIELQHLPLDEIPEALRLDAFIAFEHQYLFEHSALFKECAHVFAVLDAIHPYLVKFFEESAWMQASVENAQITILKTSAKRDKDGRCLDESDDDESSEDDDVSISHLPRRRSSSYRRNRSHWRLPECVDPDDNTEILLYPGVDPLTFAPDKIINLHSNSSHSSAGSSKSPATTPRLTSPTGRRYSYGRSSLSIDIDADEIRPQKKCIVVLPGALVLGGSFDVSDGSVFIGKNVRIEPNVFIKGPAIIGEGSTLRSGTYIRGDVIVGQSVVLRGELKNALILDRAELCHPGYCGDSVCGVKSHFGNQVTTANLNLFASSASANLTIDVDGKRYDTGRKKIGVILGDHSQLGCSAVTDPCTLLHPNTVVYPLSRLRKGIYGPNQIIKNKPMEKGVLEAAPLRQTS